MKKELLYVVFISLFNLTNCLAQQRILYKEIDTTKLYMRVINPTKMDTFKSYPALVFFFGGGWNSGNVKQFEPQAKYFSQRGMVCFLVDYRVKDRQKTTPFEAVKDAKSAIRFIRKHAIDYHIDASKIIASGGSAGGHLAATAAVITDYNEKTDDMSVSCVPNALVLFNPVIDNGPNGYGFERIGEAYKTFSPLHNIKKGTPPTLFMLGTKDNLIPVETAKKYQIEMEKVGSRCDLKIYEGGVHGFFNYTQFENYKKTVIDADTFLQSLGYLNKEPIIKIE